MGNLPVARLSEESVSVFLYNQLPTAPLPKLGLQSLLSHPCWTFYLLNLVQALCRQLQRLWVVIFGTHHFTPIFFICQLLHSFHPFFTDNPWALDISSTSEAFIASSITKRAKQHGKSFLVSWGSSLYVLHPKWACLLK